MSRFFVLLLISSTLGACGQKGDLYLETDKATENPAKTTTRPQKNTTADETEQADKAGDS